MTTAVALTAERVLWVFMALSFSVDSTPRAYTLKAGNADVIISTEGGHPLFQCELGFAETAVAFNVKELLSLGMPPA